MRLQLARALMCPADLMLLDEPTNHLDLDALVWLEAWLQRYDGTMIVISHDREFLDATTRVTLHIDEAKLTRYTGNYTAFEEMRAERMSQQQAGYQKQQERIAHLQHFIDRFKAKASKAKQAQSRVKALARMERLAPVLTSADFQFEFREPREPAEPDAGVLGRGLRLPRRAARRLRGDRRPCARARSRVRPGHGAHDRRRHRPLGARRPAHRHPRRQRPGQVDAGQDHRRRPARRSPARSPKARA